MNKKEDIDFNNISEFIKIKENREKIYERFTLLHYLNKEEDILYFIENWPTQFYFESQSLKKLTLNILNKISNKFSLNLDLMLSIDWTLMKHEEFVSFIKDYALTNERTRNMIIALIPVMEMSKIRAIKNTLDFTQDEFIKVMDKSYNYKTNRYSMQNENRILEKMKISTVWELEKQNLLGFIDELEIKISRFLQDGVYLYLKNMNFKDDFGPKNIAENHFIYSSFLNFREIMNDIKANNDEERYNAVLEDLITRKYLNNNLLSENMQNKINFLIKELHNSDALIIAKTYNEITNPIIMERFLKNNAPFYKYFKYDYTEKFNNKIINGRLLKILDDYNLIEWNSLSKLNIDDILSNMLYNSSNSEKIWGFNDIKMTINNLLIFNKDIFFERLLRSKHLNILAQSRPDILEIMKKDLLKKEKIQLYAHEKYNEKALSFIMGIEKEILQKNIIIKENISLSKRRI